MMDEEVCLGVDGYGGGPGDRAIPIPNDIDDVV
jgi:hypothetical protein